MCAIATISECTLPVEQEEYCTGYWPRQAISGSSTASGRGRLSLRRLSGYRRASALATPFVQQKPSCSERYFSIPVTLTYAVARPRIRRLRCISRLTVGTTSSHQAHLAVIVDTLLTLNSCQRVLCHYELLARAKLLQQLGPSLGRPWADTLKGSRHANLKELRFDAANGVWRVAFAFDPRRRGILLVAGDKSGTSEQRFYRALIEKADARLDSHLERLKHEDSKAGGPRRKK